MTRLLLPASGESEAPGKPPVALMIGGVAPGLDAASAYDLVQLFAVMAA